MVPGIFYPEGQRGLMRNDDKLLQEILDIGQAMLESGSEVNRAEDSIRRMCEAYGFSRIDVFILPSNIQTTVETGSGEIITQIRSIRKSGTNYDRLDYLNDLSRRVVRDMPDAAMLGRWFRKVMDRPLQPMWMRFLGGILAGGFFAVFYNGGVTDFFIGAGAGALLILVEFYLDLVEDNPMVYNFVSAFVTELFILIACWILPGGHSSRITIGVVMLMIMGLGFTNGLRDMLHRDLISGALTVLNSLLSAGALAGGIVLAMWIIRQGVGI